MGSIKIRLPGFLQWHQNLAFPFTVAGAAPDSHRLPVSLSCESTLQNQFKEPTTHLSRWWGQCTASEKIGLHTSGKPGVPRQPNFNEKPDEHPGQVRPAMKGMTCASWESMMAIVKALSIGEPCYPWHVTGGLTGIIGTVPKGFPMAN